MIALLSRTRTILHRAPDGDDSGQWFRATDEDTHAYHRRVYIDHNTWDDLGRPDTITVSIEPGDTLNP